MMICKEGTVVCNLSASFSIPSFSRNDFIFCCISDFPISHSVPPMKDKNLQEMEWGEGDKHLLLIILLIFQFPYTDHPKIQSSQIHIIIYQFLLKTYYVSMI